MEFEGGVGLGSGVRGNAVGLTVAFVLRPDGAGRNDLRLGGGNGAEDLHLFVADGFRREVGRGLHRGDRQELHHVVLHHVPHGPDLVIKRAAGADAFLLRHGDLDVVDKVAVPDRFPDGVGKTEVQEVLDRFLAEVVVDAEEIGFVEAGLKVIDQLAGGSQVVSKRFFHHYAGRQAGADEPCFGQLLDHGGKVVWGGGEIEDVLGEAAGFGEVIEDLF